MHSTLDLQNQINTFEKIVNQMQTVLLSRLSEFNLKNRQAERSSESHFKELTGLFKLLQGVEEMLKRIQDNRDRKREPGIDAMEFRRKLEEQIAQLVDEGKEELMP